MNGGKRKWQVKRTAENAVVWIGERRGNEGVLGAVVDVAGSVSRKEGFFKTKGESLRLASEC